MSPEERPVARTVRTGGVLVDVVTGGALDGTVTGAVDVRNGRSRVLLTPGDGPVGIKIPRVRRIVRKGHISAVAVVTEDKSLTRVLRILGTTSAAAGVVAISTQRSHLAHEVEVSGTGETKGFNP